MSVLEQLNDLADIQAKEANQIHWQHKEISNLTLRKEIGSIQHIVHHINNKIMDFFTQHSINSQLNQSPMAFGQGN